MVDYGALPNDGLDDSNAFEEVFKIISKSPGNYRLILPPGVLNIEKSIKVEGLVGSVKIIGQSNSVLQLVRSSLGSFTAAHFPIMVEGDNFHGSYSIKINKVIDAKNVEKDDLIHLSSNSIFETAWKYKENDIHRIESLKGSKIQIKSPLLFNYSDQIEKIKATVYKECDFTISNLKIILESSNVKSLKQRITLAAFWGVSLHLENVKIEHKGPLEYYHIGLSLLACENITLSNIELKGFMYGILMNFCRNVTAQNINAEFCRHALTPSQGSVDIKADTVKGYKCHSVIDAHCAFNVHYKNVYDSLALEYPNCRALGTFIENSRFILQGNVKQNVAYWSIQTLTKENSFLYSQYDTRFSNVNFVSKNPTNLNGLTSYSCRRLIIDNCNSHSAAYYGMDSIIQEVKIVRSNLGMLHMDTQKLEVDSTVFDGQLYPMAPFILKLRGSGIAKFNNIAIRNYSADSTYLFGFFVNSKYNKGIVFNNAKISRLKGWVKSFIYPNLPFDQVHFRNSSIERFVNDFPIEFKGLNSVIKEQIKE